MSGYFFFLLETRIFVHNIATVNNLAVRFEVFTAASLKMSVSWVVVQCNVVEVYRRFRGACCLRRQGIAMFKQFHYSSAIYFKLLRKVNRQFS
jgi:hypothetical protein